LYDNNFCFVNDELEVNLSRRVDFFPRSEYSGFDEGGGMKDLKIEVVKIKERCGAKHKVGDTFFIRGGGTIEIPAGKKVCIFALNSLFPFLTTKQREEELPGDDWISETELLTCPDPNGVIFKIVPLT
jgi:anaerobic carbon-monoxide dehydrogenase iron sulfur subunit